VEEDEQRAPGHDLAADAMEDDASLGQRMKTADERSDALESIKVDLLRSRKDRSVALSTSVTAASRRASRACPAPDIASAWGPRGQTWNSASIEPLGSTGRIEACGDEPRRVKFATRFRDYLIKLIKRSTSRRVTHV
jgi:hypothetical protein